MFLSPAATHRHCWPYPDSCEASVGKVRQIPEKRHAVVDTKQMRIANFKLHIGHSHIFYIIVQTHILKEDFDLFNVSSTNCNLQIRNNEQSKKKCFFHFMIEFLHLFS